MPRKPANQQRRYSISNHRRNRLIPWCRRACQPGSPQHGRYFVAGIAGILRAQDQKPLIHNGGKQR